MIRLTHILGGLAVVVIIALSVVPGNLRPHTGYPNAVEHIVAYAGTALLLVFGDLKWRVSICKVIGLAVFASAAEVLQNFIPQRDPSIYDALSGALGAVGGAIAARAATVLLGRHLRGL